ncbi:glutaredoxin [Ignicoccus islandicus DSM 13165]|uniref:Glutaredoxin n=1 Tax=Ignicoccus islandicus DSM 13165 TaxID=940295 RepID=A0A0U3E9M8_9CREN|nr:thioredoxin family protein [Ignicoccus islandicus]ALU12014.1 glutaredoxin [Ignicoccus islandicus DSM 13165]
MSFEQEWTPEIRSELREVLADMVNPVEVLVFIGDDCPYCKATVEMIQVFSEESPKKDGKPLLTYKVFHADKDKDAFKEYGVDRVPSVLLVDGYVRYTGIPGGEEIKGLIETIIRISEGESGLDPSTKEGIGRLEGCFYIENVVTPQCPYCPYAALLINMFAYESYKQGKKCIVADTVEAYENEDIADKYNVMSVPSISINGHVEFVGVPYEEDLLAKLVEHQGERRCSKEICFTRP